MAASRYLSIATVAMLACIARADAPYINTWLVAGTFENDANNAGLNRDWIGETNVEPTINDNAAGKTWHYFDDRLFSRNYDDYQDLHSYFRYKLGESVNAKVVYAHIHVHSVTEQKVQLRIGADSSFKAWLNGQLTAEKSTGTPVRDTVSTDIILKAGWNRLLLKIANTCDGRLGFYCRMCNKDGSAPKAFTFSPIGGKGPLRIVTQRTWGVSTGELPVAYREWPYVGAHVDPDDPDLPPLRKPENVLQSSEFQFVAGGGTPPYTWSIANGHLPAGLELDPSGVIRGTVDRNAPLGDSTFSLTVSDSPVGNVQTPMTVTVKERPNKWYEEARLTALLHSPERMPADGYAEFARLMKRQGYGVGMMIAYNNGDHTYRWPSPFEPKAPLGEYAGKYKAALEAEGVRFGLYIGNFDGTNHGGTDGALLVMADACQKYKPAAVWFDWAGWDGTSLDALFSVIRTVSPDTVIVMNGVPTLSNGDWDILVLEAWGAWGKRHWEIWPFPVSWPKRTAVETWRLITDPGFEYTKDLVPDWQEYLRLQIALICEGYVANIDHSVTIRTPIKSIDESPTMQCHRRMADWADPPGGTPLYESYTKVNPGPLTNEAWGYNTISLDRRTIYLHMLRTPFGKTGKPNTPLLKVGPLQPKVTAVTWLNARKPVQFKQDGSNLMLDLLDITADPIDTIIRIELAEAAPDTQPDAKEPQSAPNGNLALRKPTLLLSADGLRRLPTSAFQFARYGVDGFPFTAAQAGNEWAWTYQVDLQKVHEVNRVVIQFGAGYATEYELLLSADGKQWTTAAHVTNATGGKREHTFTPTTVRYVRVRSFKPDAPNQPGIQMAIGELEVYEASSNSK